MIEEKRTHRERLSKLREVFGKRQEIAKQTGKKHDVSIAKICSDANVDKIYLFGHRLKENDPIRSEYLALKNEILKFQENLAKGIEKSNDRIRADELEIKYKTLLTDLEPLQRELAYFKATSNNDKNNINNSRDRVTELLARISQLESQLANFPKKGDVFGSTQIRLQKHLVSPDKFRIVNGSYRIGTKKQEEESWGMAYKKLEELLSRNLKMRLYLLVGLPCSGKTTWAEEVELNFDRHPVIWDATNLTSMDRYRLIVSISRFIDLPKTCVFFDTDMETIRDRNRTLRLADKRISDDDLSTLVKKLERPNIYEETWIDDLIVIRPKNDI